MVVEDEWLIALDIEMMIEEAGHTVVGPAQIVAAALTMIQDNAIEAALLGVTLGSEKFLSLLKNSMRCAFR
ncbi:hypothetical protein [uncultured Sulfitobacter sp.]|uniref:hypothetical protein n=1 Tax=uncultured Sulfitobacter sp. TaxID=191468 RepID=UPI0026323C5D|nr:hypothetical protein [uncultured Sulfitobacter sp.]